MRLTKRILLASALLLAPALPAAAKVAIDKDDIGGTVVSAKGPEAGVWVIAETADLPTRFIKIVVTDDQGRYVIPDLPKAKFKIWVRGYGLVDSEPVAGEPGKEIDLKAVVAPTVQAAAFYYPANYWESLLTLPPPGDFPGTGPRGNGWIPSWRTQDHFLTHFKENCHVCHQIGSRWTRAQPQIEGAATTLEGWDKRVTKNAAMNNHLSRMGRGAALKMFADWTDRIAKGEVPEAPPRPAGQERNIVLSIFDWADGDTVHDEITSDKRDPTINANGPVYGTKTGAGALATLDPNTYRTGEIKLPTEASNGRSAPHNPMIDEKGRVWNTMMIRDPEPRSWCYDGAINKFARNLPMKMAMGYMAQTGWYDPKNGEVVPVDTCFGTHHLNFSTDAENTLYLSGEINALGWVNVRTFEKTRDASKSVGWCPLVLDTNGDGKTAMNGTWVDQEDPGDPTKDLRLRGFLYGMGVSPTDGSAWFAYYTSKGVNYDPPSGIIRFTKGDNPPETCHTEYYEPPVKNGKAMAFNVRGVDLDSNGIAWAAFGSGQIGRFDRSKCKVLNGPTATGQHCPEGWTFYSSPGPGLRNVEGGITADWSYLGWVDRLNILGLGRDVPVYPGSNSDSLLALLPDTGKYVVLRVPYPMGFYARGLDGRVDDPKAGWKGRGLWSSYNGQLQHVETENGKPKPVGKVVKFQLRPDPLAH